MSNINDPTSTSDATKTAFGAAERLPHGGDLRKFFRLSDEVDYHDGEQASG